MRSKHDIIILGSVSKEIIFQVCMFSKLLKLKHYLVILTAAIGVCSGTTARGHPLKATAAPSVLVQ